MPLNFPSPELSSPIAIIANTELTKENLNLSDEFTKLLTHMQEVGASRIKFIEEIKEIKEIKEIYESWNIENGGKKILEKKDIPDVEKKQNLLAKFKEDINKISAFFLQDSSLDANVKNALSNDFLHDYLKGIDKLDLIETFMSNLVSYMSKLVIAKKAKELNFNENEYNIIEVEAFLNAFPGMPKNEYQCLDGSLGRLKNASLKLFHDDYLRLIASDVLEKDNLEYSGKVLERNRVHFLATLQYLVGVNPDKIDDKLYYLSMRHFSLKTLLDIKFTYPEKLNKALERKIGHFVDKILPLEPLTKKTINEILEDSEFKFSEIKFFKECLENGDNGGRDLFKIFLNEDDYTKKSKEEIVQTIKQKIAEDLEARKEDLAKEGTSIIDWYSHCPESIKNISHNQLISHSMQQEIADLFVKKATDNDEIYEAKKITALQLLETIGEDYKSETVKQYKNIAFLLILDSIKKKDEFKSFFNIESTEEFNINSINEENEDDIESKIKEQYKPYKEILKRILTREKVILKEYNNAQNRYSNQQQEVLKFYQELAGIRDNGEKLNKYILSNKRKIGDNIIEFIIANDDAVTLNALINNNIIDLSYENTRNSTLLHLASSFGSSKIVEALLAKGVDINAKNNDRDTPLHYAARYGHTEIVKALLAKGADVNTKNEYGITPLHYAAKNGHTGIVEALLEKEVIEVNSVTTYNNDTALHYAVQNNNIVIVKALLAKGGIEVNAKNENGATPLHLAVQNNNIVIVKALLAKEDIEVNAEKKDRDTALHLAVINKHAEIVEALLEKGVDVNTKNKNGFTPLQSAVINKHAGIVKALLEKGVNINAEDKDIDTALHYAAQNGHTEIVKALLEKGVDVNTKNKYGFTPLHYAARYGHTKTVKALLENGADCMDLKINNELISKYKKVQGLLINVINTNIDKSIENIQSFIDTFNSTIQDDQADQQQAKEFTVVGKVLLYNKTIKINLTKKGAERLLAKLEEKRQEISPSNSTAGARAQLAQDRVQNSSQQNRAGCIAGCIVA